MRLFLPIRPLRARACVWRGPRLSRWEWTASLCAAPPPPPPPPPTHPENIVSLSILGTSVIVEEEIEQVGGGKVWIGQDGGKLDDFIRGSIFSGKRVKSFFGGGDWKFDLIPRCVVCLCVLSREILSSDSFH